MGKNLYHPKPVMKTPEYHKIFIAIILFLFCAPISVLYVWLGTSWSKKTKGLITFFVLVLPAIFIGIFGLLYETVYSVRMDTPKYTSNPLEYSKRPTQSITPEQVFIDMRDTPDRSLALRKAEWVEKYQGRWIQWEGEVTSIQAFENTTNQMTLKPDMSQSLEVQGYFDPLNYSELNLIEVGDIVKISGVLWGYYFLGDMIRLADGHLVNHISQPSIMNQNH